MKEIKKIGFLFCLVAMASFVLPVIGCQQPSSGGSDSLYKGSSSGSGGSNTGADGGGSFGSNTEPGGSGGTSGGDSESSSYFTVAEAAEYISSLTEKGTYYVKVVDYEETSSEALRAALANLYGMDIYIELDLYEIIVEICDYAFYKSGANYCDALKAISLPSSATYIGNYAFFNCLSLESVTIPDSVTSIGYYAFCACSSLEYITIPESIKTIGESAFSECSLLKKVILNEGLKKIGKTAFFSCKSLKIIELPTSIEIIGKHVFGNSSNMYLESILFKEEHEWYATETENLEKRIKTETFSTINPSKLEDYLLASCRLISL